MIASLSQVRMMKVFCRLIQRAEGYVGTPMDPLFMAMLGTPDGPGVSLAATPRYAEWLSNPYRANPPTDNRNGWSDDFPGVVCITVTGPDLVRRNVIAISGIRPPSGTELAGLRASDAELVLRSWLNERNGVDTSYALDFAMSVWQALRAAGVDFALPCYITGYSAGSGAAFALAAMLLSGSKESVQKLYTIGAPRFVNEGCYALLGEALPYPVDQVNFNSQYDLIAYCPPSNYWLGSMTSYNGQSLSTQFAQGRWLLPPIPNTDWLSQVGSVAEVPPIPVSTFLTQDAANSSIQMVSQLHQSRAAHSTPAYYELLTRQQTVLETDLAERFDISQAEQARLRREAERQLAEGWEYFLSWASDQGTDAMGFIDEVIVPNPPRPNFPPITLGSLTTRPRVTHDLPPSHHRHHHHSVP